MSERYLEWLITTTAANQLGNIPIFVAPAVGFSIAIAGWHVLNEASTRSIFDFGFREGVGGIVRFRNRSNTAGHEISKDFVRPWIMESSGSFNMNIIKIGTAAETPAFSVTVYGYTQRRT